MKALAILVLFAGVLACPSFGQEFIPQPMSGITYRQARVYVPVQTYQVGEPQVFFEQPRRVRRRPRPRSVFYVWPFVFCSY